MVEAGGDQVQAQRAVPRRPRVRQYIMTTARTGVVSPRGREGGDEELPQRDAGVQVWHQ